MTVTRWRWVRTTTGVEVDPAGEDDVTELGDEEAILRTCRTLAVVGLSPRAERPSHRVASYLKEQGYTIVPINPQVGEILGEVVYPDLMSVPGPVDVAVVFRRSDGLADVVDQAIAVGARAVWMQEGVVDQQAAAKARAAGLLVVMDKCMRKEHLRLAHQERGGFHEQDE